MVHLTRNFLLMLALLAGVVLWGCSKHSAQLSTPTQRLLHEISKQNETTPSDSLLVLSPAMQEAFGVRRSSQGLFVQGILKISNPQIETNLTRLGVRINSKVNQIWTATLPLSTLDALTHVKGVEAIDIDMPVRKRSP